MSPWHISPRESRLIAGAPGDRRQEPTTNRAGPFTAVKLVHVACVEFTWFIRLSRVSSMTKARRYDTIPRIKVTKSERTIARKKEREKETALWRGDLWSAHRLLFASCLLGSQLLLLPPHSPPSILLLRLLLPLKSLLHRARDSGFLEFEKLVPRLFAFQRTRRRHGRATNVCCVPIICYLLKLMNHSRRGLIVLICRMAKKVSEV